MSYQTISLKINDLPVNVPEGTSILEAAQTYGVDIPTLCDMEGLTSYGACRLCIVEIGPAENPRVVSSCTYRCEEAMEVRKEKNRR